MSLGKTFGGFPIKLEEEAVRFHLKDVFEPWTDKQELSRTRNGQMQQHHGWAPCGKTIRGTLRAEA